MSAWKYPARTEVCKEILLPVETMGLVIGAGGRTIGKIQEITSCWIQLWRGDQVTVEIIGPSEELTAKAAWLLEGISAKYIVFECLDVMAGWQVVEMYSADLWRKMTVGTPLDDLSFVSMQEETRPYVLERNWKSWCPCCKRPLAIKLEGSEVGEPGEIFPFHSSEAIRQPCCAYVATLWGDDPGFVLGALVLGHALRCTSQAGHRRVLLHTCVVPTKALSKLQHFWELEQVPYLHACDRLFMGGTGGRFDGTFTKLHVLGLVEFTKILVLDLDLVIFDCLDHLFDLKAPAALCRGANDRTHGCHIDGTRFFLGGDDSDADRYEWCWCQGGGINAGVMLLEPNLDVYHRVLKEIDQKFHPGHIPGGGPEQDYLSRFYAPYWHHISVSYNFQIHHVLYNLESVLGWWRDAHHDDKYLPARMKQEASEIGVIHFSGTLKIWDRDYQGAGESDEAFAIRILQNCNPEGFRRWVVRNATVDEYAEFNVVQVDECGTKTFYVAPSGGVGPVIGAISAESLVQRSVKLAEAVSLRAVVRWREDFEAMLQRHRELWTLESLLCDLREASGDDACNFHPSQSVEFRWKSQSIWYPGVVRKIRDDGTLDVECLDDGWYGFILRVNSSDLRVR